MSVCVTNVALGGHSDIEHRPAMQDDPQRRRPDISRAKKYISWQPRVSLFNCLQLTDTILN